MKILISGATGLVGQELVRLCIKQGIAVNYLTTRSDKIQHENQYRGFLWNPNKEEIDLHCFEGVKAIVNLAGASISKRWTSNYKQQILSSRLNSLRTLKKGLDAVNTSDINSFVTASAIGIYPNSLEQYYSEDEKMVDDSFLGDVVYKWEQEADTFESFDFEIAKLRIGIVLSANGGALKEMAKPVKFGLGAAFGNGQQWQSWIHITDLARMFLFIIENQLSGIYNGVAPNPVSQNKMMKEIALSLSMPLILPKVPKFFIKTLVGEMSDLLLFSQRVSSKKIAEKGFAFLYQNINGALEDIYKKHALLAEDKTADSREYQS